MKRVSWGLILTMGAVGLLGCVAGSLGPQTPSDAFEWAELEPPAQYDALQFEGSSGIDSQVILQFVMPDATRASDYLSDAGCVLAPVGPENGDPFSSVGSGPDWLVLEGPEGTQSCCHEPSPGSAFYRGIRVDPLPDGRVRVQIRAFTI